MLNRNEKIRENRELYNECFKKYDTIVGTVIGFNSSGCYVRDEKSGRSVFYFGNGMKGDKVQLTVNKVDAEKERVTCVLESVLEYGEFCA